MKYLIIFILSLFAQILLAQDKLYLLDGTKKNIKLLEIGLESVTYAELSESGAPFLDSKITVANSDILLIEYKNGKIEIFNRPEKNLITTQRGMISGAAKKNEAPPGNNLVSFNTLALCVADISVFYEYISPTKKLGIGAMGAYNFNQAANAIVTNISILNNGKKNFDLGGFVNIYPSAFKRKVTISYGLMIKYTALSFSKNIGTSTNVVYSTYTGSQLATFLTFGMHKDLSKNLFVKTIVGLGAFRLRGDYKEEFNQAAMGATGSAYYDYTYRAKLYLGLNLGLRL